MTITRACDLLGLWRELKSALPTQLRSWATQLEVAASFIEGRDVFSVLPTGFGKSLCYACLPLAFDQFMKKERGYSLVIVVTPLVSIMEDQVKRYMRFRFGVNT